MSNWATLETKGGCYVWLGYRRCPATEFLRPRPATGTHCSLTRLCFVCFFLSNMMTQEGNT